MLEKLKILCEDKHHKNDATPSIKHVVGIHPNDLSTAFKDKHIIRKAADDALVKLMPSIKHIPKEHLNAVNTWAGDDTKKGRYREINDHLRNGKAVDPKLKESIKNLHGFINDNPLKHDVHVYRGLHAPMSESVQKLKPGDLYTDKGFMSTTISPKRASYFAKEGKGVFCHFHMPKGSKATYLDHPDLTPFSENEVLIPPNTKMRYKGYTNFNHPEAGTIKLHHFKLEQ
jgi:hypothetical protein